MGKRQVQRANTKLAILAAFENLCSQHPYTEISVADICAEAQISKPTFYRHFQSKENLIRWMAKQTLHGGVIEIGRSFSWYEGYLHTLSVEYRHRAFYANKQSPELVSSLLDFTAQYQRSELIRTITEIRGYTLTEKLKFQIEALMVVEGVSSRRWAAEGMVVSPKVMAEYMTSIVPHELFLMLNEPLDADQLAGVSLPRELD